jgi:2-amino-4-hydroxy-6-hydroxymethyldihydropteridine diphosphokinase
MTSHRPTDPYVVRAYIGLGANLGDSRRTLQAAVHELSAVEGIRSLKMSRLYRSAPIDSSGPDYINAVVEIETALRPHALLTSMQCIEDRHGRLRPYRNAPRTLDLDLLLFGDEVIQDAQLIVPHPRMHERAFVLRPLADLAPDLKLAQGCLSDLIVACEDQRLEVLPA